jgi:hypothetical protein
MNKTIILLLGLVLLLAPLSGSARAAVSVGASFNFTGATVEDSCIPSIDADPYLQAADDGPSDIVNTTNAGGSAPECHMSNFTAFNIWPETGNIFTGVTFLYSGMFHVELYNTITHTVIQDTNFSGTGVFSYSGAEFDSIHISAHEPDGQNFIDNGSVAVQSSNPVQPQPGTTQLPGCDQYFTIYSSALVTTHQPGFWKPGGEAIVLSNGTALDVLHDVDLNGQDEFLVIDKVTFHDEHWVGLFIGACHPVYVLAENVTLLRPITW